MFYLNNVLQMGYGPVDWWGFEDLGVWSTFKLTLLPGPLRPGVVLPIRNSLMG